MFAVAERGRARALLDLLGEARVGLRSKAPADWRASYTAALGELNSAEKLLGQANLQEAERQVQRGRLDSAEAELERLEATLRRNNPILASLQAPVPVGVETLQEDVLAPDEVVLVYSLGEAQSFIYVISQTRYEVIPLVGQEKLLPAVGRIYASVSQPLRRVSPADLSVVSRLLLEPVERFLPAGSRVLIVPDGALFYLPFELLGNLLRDHAISYQPSASVLALARQHGTPSRSTRDLLAMAPFVSKSVVVTASRNLTLFSRDDWTHPEPLPSTRQEVEAIAGLYAEEQVSIYFGAAAQEEILKSPEARNYRRLHLATHAFANPEAPRRSSVVLSQENLREDEDGLLTLYELFTLDLDADLVVLSACDTGLGKLEKGEGMVGLTRGFLYAGARALVVSLWEVRDQATAIFMERFYRNMKGGMSKVEALRQAKLSFLNDEEMPAWRNPHYWAPFILVGDVE